MRKNELILIAAMCCGAAEVRAQGETLTPLGARPVPEALNALRKSGEMHAHFDYDYLVQTIPLADDFSVDRTRKRWAQPDDPGVTLTGTIYRLEIGGVSTPDMAFAQDTTFFYMTDTAGTDTTVRSALPAITVLVRDLSVYPPTDETLDVWPSYNIFDTVQAPSPDTLYLIPPDLVQDSLMEYSVAADTRTYIRPDNSVVPWVLWEDDDVYINGNYPIEPPTIGVATFDGLARTGYPYNFAQYTAYGVADHLTTVGIQLGANTPQDSLYLSFFYQPQGLSGDGNVQSIDSLILEFYAPLEQLWYPAWKTPYIPLQDFEQVLVPITDLRYFHNGFKFRFSNYATLSGSFDHWHLDYVRLAAQRTFDDTRLIDVAYMYPETSLLQTYTSVPFHKFDDAPASYMAQSVTALQRNLDSEDRFITYGFLAKEENDATVFARSSGNNTSGNALQIFPSDHAINPAAQPAIYDPSLSTDAAFWRVKLWTNTTPDNNRYNDTVTFVQEISNYMSYDDGSAEMGYGLLDAGNALAYRYDIVGGDSLRAIRMYFNPQANDPQSSPNPDEGSFLLSVWTDLSQEPVFQNFTSFSPQYRSDGIDHFTEYLLDSAIYVEGMFYVGFVQTADVRMNLGFDRNRNNQNKIFYKTVGGFTNTNFEGSLMMRPVFVAAVDPFAAMEEMSIGSALTLVPNPANDAVLIRCEGAIPGSIVQCLDATGRLVKQETWSAARAMLISELNQGMYILRMIDHTGAPIAQERLLIQR